MSWQTRKNCQVSLIVVNFNGSLCLKSCLESLVAGELTPIQLIVVDNASTDDSRAVLRQLAAQYPFIEILESETNLGYAGAVNQALPRCHGRYIGVANMDVVAESNWLAPLVDFLDANPGVGIACPLITVTDGQTINALGQDLHVTGLGYNRGLGESRFSVGMAPIRVAGAHGAAFMARRSLLDESGGMDSSGFLYHEDVNLSWIARLLGYEIYCVPASIVRHDYFLSMHEAKLFLLERNRWVLLLTTLQWPTLVALAPAILLTEAMLWAYTVLRGPTFMAAKAKSYAALWRQRSAMCTRRAEIQAMRRLRDRQLLRHMRWRYPWRQFLVLAREKGSPRRPFSSDGSIGRGSN